MASCERHTSRRSHPLIERRHLALLHMAPGQHRLIERVPLSLPLTAAQASGQWLDGAAHLGAGDGAQPGTAAARAHLVDSLPMQAAQLQIADCSSGRTAVDRQPLGTRPYVVALEC